MSDVQEFVELQSLNTFKVKSLARYFLQLNSLSQVQQSIDIINKHRNRMVLGGGSNLLFISDYDGLIIYPQLFGIEKLSEDQSTVTLSVGASENWHDFVKSTCDSGYYGLENLALIPGTVGASPVQNIGAYGVEVKSFIEMVEVVDLNTAEVRQFSNAECQFGYRNSVFKQAEIGRFLITRVDFKLLKRPDLCLSYQPLKDLFADDPDVTPKRVLDKVCQVRQQKLPDPADIPNAGSFFKNPVVTTEHYLKLKQSYPELVAYPADDEYKLAAGWLIDKAGFKGLREGKVGVHKNQALVLANYEDDCGLNVWRLAKTIRLAIKKQFAVELEVEVRVVGDEQ